MSRADQVYELREAGLKFREIAARLGISKGRANQCYFTALRKRADPRRNSIKRDLIAAIPEGNGSNNGERVYNALCNMIDAPDYPSRSWVCQHTEADLKGVPNLGKLGIEIVKRWLAQEGFKLRN